LKVHLSDDGMLSWVVIDWERLSASSDGWRSFLLWKIDDPVDHMRAFSPFALDSVGARLPMLGSADVLLDDTRIVDRGEQMGQTKTHQQEHEELSLHLTRFIQNLSA
jgi:hypothetical protein